MQQKQTWSGERIYLRPLKLEDLDDRYASWFIDDRVTDFLDARNITVDDARRFYRAGIETGSHVQLAICELSSHLMIGSVKIGPIIKTHGVSDLVTLIGDPGYWGKGLATEAITLANEIAFDELSIRKLSGGIISGNVGSIKCYTRAGWLIEAVLKGHYLIDGMSEDRVAVSCFNPRYFSEEDTKQAAQLTRIYLGNLDQRK